MPESPCLTHVRKLYEAIQARLTGEQVQSFGQRNRSMAFAEVSLKDMINMYIQQRAQCPAAIAELPELKPLDAPVGTRGGPARHRGRSWC